MKDCCKKAYKLALIEVVLDLDKFQWKSIEQIKAILQRVILILEEEENDNRN